MYCSTFGIIVASNPFNFKSGENQNQQNSTNEGEDGSPVLTLRQGEHLKYEQLLSWMKVTHGSVVPVSLSR